VLLLGHLIGHPAYTSTNYNTDARAVYSAVIIVKPFQESLLSLMTVEQRRADADPRTKPTLGLGVCSLL